VTLTSAKKRWLTSRYRQHNRRFPWFAADGRRGDDPRPGMAARLPGSGHVTLIRPDPPLWTVWEWQ
jgi:hypothetical protein